jgi:Uma2 family endonuclease
MAVRADDLYRVRREDYLAEEAAASEKSEWVDGVIYAMAGASKRHVEAVMTLIGILIGPARAHGCFIGASDLLVQTENAYYYPDVVVSCEPSEDDRIETKPCFLVEVLSPTTKRVDRMEKRDAYFTIPTMQDYWIVDLHTKVVEAWNRGPDGWSGSHFHAGQPMRVSCLDLQIKVVDIVGV